MENEAKSEEWSWGIVAIIASVSFLFLILVAALRSAAGNLSAESEYALLEREYALLEREHELLLAMNTLQQKTMLPLSRSFAQATSAAEALTICQTFNDISRGYNKLVPEVNAIRAKLREIDPALARKPLESSVVFNQAFLDELDAGNLRYANADKDFEPREP